MIHRVLSALAEEYQWDVNKVFCRMPVATVFENLQAGASIEDIMEWFDVSREQVTAALEFAARTLEVSPPTR